MMKIKVILGVLAGILIAMFATPALASGGSDSTTPYVVGLDGITLPAGDTFPDNGHINVRTTNEGDVNMHFESKCITRTDAECEGDRHAFAQYIGKSFVPWSAFGFISPCVSWVQISHYNQHFGEGEQPPVGPGCTSPSAEPTTDSPETPTTPSATPTEPEPTLEPTPTVEPSTEPTEAPTTTQPTFIPMPQVPIYRSPWELNDHPKVIGTPTSEVWKAPAKVHKQKQNTDVLANTGVQLTPFKIIAGLVLINLGIALLILRNAIRKD